MKRALIGLVIVAVLGVAIRYAISGGEKSGPLGTGVGASVVPVAEVQGHPEKYLGKSVTVEGELTKECPSSGCWWYLKDSTGEIRADSLHGGFTLPLKQEGRRIRTTGTVGKTEGGDLQILATGAEFR